MPWLEAQAYYDNYVLWFVINMWQFVNGHNVNQYDIKNVVMATNIGQLLISS